MSRRIFYSESENLCLQRLVRKYGLFRKLAVFDSLSAKKNAWARLTQEFNSIESNSRRTEAQLRKCWDNLKTRKKVLINEKRERMRVTSGPYPGSSSSQSVVPEAVDPLETSDLELKFSISDTKIMPDLTPIDSIPSVQLALNAISTNFMKQLLHSHLNRKLSKNLPLSPPELLSEIEMPQSPPFTAQHKSTHTSAPQWIGKNVRVPRIPLDQHQPNTHTNTSTYNHNRSEEREEELHRLKMAERQWQVKAAEETYLKAKIDRQCSEERLRYVKAVREEAEKRIND